jgi:choline dehydrogenase
MEAAMQKSGLEPIDGLNSGKLIGYGTMTMTIDPRTATRSSSETSFLQLAASQSSIKIYPEALVKRITFDGTKATGIDIQANSITADMEYHLTAKKEVIVSAGVVSGRTTYRIAVLTRIRSAVAFSSATYGFRCGTS